MKLMLALALALGATPLAAQPAPVTMTEARAADGTHSLSHEVIVAAPPEAVWAAISTPEGWRTWAVPVAWTPDDAPDVIEASYSPTAQPNDATTIRQQLIEREPGRRLVFRTIKGPDGFPHFNTYRQVVSTFDLTPEGEGRTRVRLTGAGYADSDAGRQLLGFFREGNRISLERLRDRFVTP